MNYKRKDKMNERPKFIMILNENDESDYYIWTIIYGVIFILYTLQQNINPQSYIIYGTRDRRRWLTYSVIKNMDPILLS